MEKAAVIAALERLSGTNRLLIYEVPAKGAPQRASMTTPFVHGSEAWWQFVEQRRALDNGADLNLLVSLRGLRTDERLLAVSWGTAFANSFLIIEPADPWLDLTTDEGIEAFARQRHTQTGDDLIRAAYAEWIYWVRDEEGVLESRAATLDLADPDATLWQTIAARLPDTFPESAFLSSLTLLNLREAELFTGGREVARSIVPFLTRLGLPILYDGRHVLHGIRLLVNAGLAWVQDPDDDWRVYRGPDDLIPAELPDEQLAMMLR